AFSTFDTIARGRGLEKIKTIGDAYMAVGGIPVPNRTHPLDCVLAALEIRDAVDAARREREGTGRAAFSIRIGVHTGPLVAGVVGRSKFAYDVWGDTVNTASRMESSGEPGCVNISRETCDAVGAFFECEPRGRIYAKNKGEIEMFFVHRLRAEFSE